MDSRLSAQRYQINESYLRKLMILVLNRTCNECDRYALPEACENPLFPILGTGQCVCAYVYSRLRGTAAKQVKSSESSGERRNCLDHVRAFRAVFNVSVAYRFQTGACKERTLVFATLFVCTCASPAASRRLPHLTCNIRKARPTACIATCEAYMVLRKCSYRGKLLHSTLNMLCRGVMLLNPSSTHRPVAPHFCPPWHLACLRIPHSHRTSYRQVRPQSPSDKVSCCSPSRASGCH